VNFSTRTLVVSARSRQSFGKLVQNIRAGKHRPILTLSKVVDNVPPYLKKNESRSSALSFESGRTEPSQAADGVIKTKEKISIVIGIDLAALVSSGNVRRIVRFHRPFSLLNSALSVSFPFFFFFPARTRNVALRGRNPPRLIGRSTADHSDHRTVVPLAGHPR